MTRDASQYVLCEGGTEAEERVLGALARAIEATVTFMMPVSMQQFGCRWPGFRNLN